jgi:hypothetical protein
MASFRSISLLLVRECTAVFGRGQVLCQRAFGSSSEADLTSILRLEVGSWDARRRVSIFG